MFLFFLFCFEKFVLGTNVLVLLFFYKCLVDRYIFWLKCFVAKQKKFFLFCFSRCEWPPSAAVPGSHRLTCLTSQTEKHQKQGTKKRKNEKTRHEKDWETKAPNGRRQRQQKRNKHQHTHIEWTHPQRHQRKSRKNMKNRILCFFVSQSLDVITQKILV